MQIVKTTVQAKTRNLKANWTLTSSDFEIRPFEPAVRDLMITEAKRKRKLQEHGTRVAYYDHDISDIMDWCQESIKGDYEQNPHPTLMSVDDLKHEIRYAETGERDSNYMEFKWIQALQRQIDSEDSQVPTGFMWFEDANEAMLFKLTWGGQ